MTYGRHLLAIALSLSISLCPAADKASHQPPAYKPLRFDEDYEYLSNSTHRRDRWDPIKYIRLGTSPDWYLSIGGELRERYEYYSETGFGLEGGSDDYLLHRLLIHADLHLGNHFRTFVQFGSHYVFGKEDEIAPIDQNIIDIQQAFADISLDTSAGRFLLRGGRQELAFGSQRLIAVRESPNVRRSFDGVRFAYDSKPVRIDAFVTRPVELRRGAFNDNSDDRTAFWGVYAFSAVPCIAGLKLDLYYLGLINEDAEYLQGIATERRHSIGIRLSGKTRGLDYNFEFVYQFGSFGTAGIRAWTAASDTGYTWTGLPFKPRFGLKVDIASGDDDPKDGTLGTFNPLFPKIAYFTENSLFVPANLINVYPSLALELKEGLLVSVGWDVLWRESTRDAFYLNPLSPLPSSEASRNSFIGSEATVDLRWQFNRHVQISASYVRFFAGDTIEDAGGKDVDFVGL